MYIPLLMWQNIISSMVQKSISFNEIHFILLNICKIALIANKELTPHEINSCLKAIDSELDYIKIF